MSDWVPQITSRLEGIFQWLLGISVNLSSGYRLQRIGQIATNQLQPTSHMCTVCMYFILFSLPDFIYLFIFVTCFKTCFWLILTLFVLFQPKTDKAKFSC